ncbi:hypothetical protein GGU11DRAFT_803682, partial [Lentinula aff. detonsa]
MEFQKSWELRTIFSLYVFDFLFLFIILSAVTFTSGSVEIREPSVVSAMAIIFIVSTNTAVLYLIFDLYYILPG